MNQPLFFRIGDNTFTAEKITTEKQEPMWHLKYNKVTVLVTTEEPDFEVFIAFVKDCIKQIEQ